MLKKEFKVMADQSFIEFLIDVTMDYYQKPKGERQQMKEEKKKQPSSPYSDKWFGMLPSTIKQLRKPPKKK